MLLALLATAAAIVGALSAASRAAACTSQLPDCRAYEQVSPIAKNTTDAVGKPGYVQSSRTGESVSYNSVVPFPEALGASEFPSYVAERGASDWTTQSLNPLTEPGAESNVLGLTGGNDEALIFVTSEAEEKFLLAPGAEVGHGNVYVRNNLNGGYKLLATRPRTVHYEASTPDGSRVLFTSTAQELVQGIVDEEEVPYLYEWSRETGQVRFVGYVNGEAPAEGTVAGSNENEGSETYDENTIAEDGSRIFFSTIGGKVYVREPEPGAERTVEVSEGDAQWRGATSDGSKAFFTEGESPNQNLYEYDVAAAKRTPITEGTAGVLGVAGISSDGLYVYFVAEGVLAVNENHNKEKAAAGMANLYEWHEGSPIAFVATLLRLHGGNDDRTDWLGYYNGGEGGSEEGFKGARISADGTRVLVSSFAKLTSYDNAGRDEIYLYDAPNGELKCVSCNPTGAPAVRETYLSANGQGSFPALRDAFTLTRNLSAEGTRVFFQTEEALLPQANAQMNVYEWEQEGAGSCGPEEGDENGGCLYLISTGQSASASYFGDASESGGDVFFFTRQSLVGEDKDQNIDVYDARENGGIAGQNPAPSPQPCPGETCRGAIPPSPVFGAPYSTTFSGFGNAAAPKPAVKPRAKTRPQKLAAALKACARRPKSKRARCRARAQKAYGAAVKAKKAKSDGGDK